VGLGESVHTSGGYSDAKVRIFRFLVEDHGFRAFAIESPRVDALLVTDYVETCSGDPTTVVTQGLFGVWANTAVLHLVEWMCSWNQMHPNDRVHFFGFDTQDPWGDGKELQMFLTAAVANPSDAAALNMSLSSCDGATSGTVLNYYTMHPSGTTTITPAQLAACGQALDAIDHVLATQGAALSARTSSASLEVAKINSIALRGWEGEMYHDPSNPQGDNNFGASFTARDQAMAQILLRIRALRYPGLKTAVWAHNGHISKLGSPGEWENMGSALEAALADDYFTLALTGFNVEINWPGQMAPPPPLPDSVEAMLHAFGRPYLLVDLTFPGTTMPFLMPNTSYDVAGQLDVPTTQYNGLLYLDHSPPMHALEW
jgi:erythromycin esterase